MNQLRDKVTASSLERAFACPGSVRLSLGIDTGKSVYALDGNFAHKLCEEMLNATKPNDFKPGYRLKLRDGETAEATEEMIDAALIYVKQVRQHVGRVEVEVNVRHEGHARNAYADAVVDDGKTLVVIDFKFGFTPVHLVGDDDQVNPQLMYYAAGALAKKKWKHRHAILEIVQPRCREVELVQSVTLPAKQIKSWMENDLYSALYAVDAPDAPLVAGDHCRFCPALSVCPAVHEKSQELAMTEFSEVAKLHVPDDPHKLAKILKLAPIIDAWLRACEAAAQAELEAGGSVPGFKLVAKRSNRQWPENRTPIQIVKALGVPMGKVKDCYTQPELLSPTQMEKVVGKEIVNAVAVKPDAGNTIAAESDRREAVGPTRDFEELL